MRGPVLIERDWPVRAALLALCLLTVSSCTSGSPNSAARSVSRTGPSVQSQAAGGSSSGQSFVGAPGSPAKTSEYGTGSSATTAAAPRPTLDSMPNPSHLSAPARSVTRPASSAIAVTSTSSGIRPSAIVSPGGIDQTVPAAPIAPTTTAELKDQIDTGQIRIALIGSGKFDFRSGRNIGDLSGPALKVTLRIANTTKVPIDLSATTVAATFGSNEVGAPLTGGEDRPFLGTLAGGATKQGTYLFSLPKSARNPLRLSVSYSVSALTVVFIGPFQ